MNRHRRTLIALAVVGVASYGLGSAHASTFAGTYRGVEVDFSVRGADAAQYDVSLIATQNVVSVPSEQNLYITITRCTSTSNCRRIQHSKQPLKDGEIVISPDMSKATLHTVVRGVHVDVEAATTYVDP